MQIRKSKENENACETLAVKFVHHVVILKCSQIRWKRKKVQQGIVYVWLVWCNCAQFFFCFLQSRSSLSISTLAEYRCGLIHLHCTAGYEHNKSSHVGPTTGVAANPIMMIGPGLEGTWWWLLMEMSILALLPKPRSDKARAAKIGSEVRKCLHPCSDRECVLRYCVGKPSRKSEQNKTTPKPNTDVIVWETCSYINNEVLRHGPPLLIHFTS